MYSTKQHIVRKSLIVLVSFIGGIATSVLATSVYDANVQTRATKMFSAITNNASKLDPIDIPNYYSLVHLNIQSLIQVLTSVDSSVMVALNQTPMTDTQATQEVVHPATPSVTSSKQVTLSNNETYVLSWTQTAGVEYYVAADGGMSVGGSKVTGTSWTVPLSGYTPGSTHTVGVKSCATGTAICSTWSTVTLTIGGGPDRADDSGMRPATIQISPSSGTFNMTTKNTLTPVITGVAKENTLVCNHVIRHPGFPSVEKPEGYCNNPANFAPFSGNEDWTYRDGKWIGSIAYNAGIYGAAGIKVKGYWKDKSTGAITTYDLDVVAGTNSTSTIQISPSSGTFNMTTKNTLTPVITGVTKENTLVCNDVLVHPSYPQAVSPIGYCTHPENFAPFSGNEDWTYRDGKWIGSIAYNAGIYGAAGIKVKGYWKDKSTGAITTYDLDVVAGTNTTTNNTTSSNSCTWQYHLVAGPVGAMSNDPSTTACTQSNNGVSAMETSGNKQNVATCTCTATQVSTNDTNPTGPTTQGGSAPTGTTTTSTTSPVTTPETCSATITRWNCESIKANTAYNALFVIGNGNRMPMKSISHCGDDEGGFMDGVSTTSYRLSYDSMKACTLAKTTNVTTNVVNCKAGNVNFHTITGNTEKTCVGSVGAGTQGEVKTVSATQGVGSAKVTCTPNGWTVATDASTSCTTLGGVTTGNPNVQNTAASYISVHVDRGIVQCGNPQGNNFTTYTPSNTGFVLLPKVNCNDKGGQVWARCDSTNYNTRIYNDLSTTSTTDLSCPVAQSTPCTGNLPTGLGVINTSSVIPAGTTGMVGMNIWTYDATSTASCKWKCGAGYTVNTNNSACVANTANTTGNQTTTPATVNVQTSSFSRVVEYYQCGNKTKDANGIIQGVRNVAIYGKSQWTADTRPIGFPVDSDNMLNINGSSPNYMSCNSCDGSTYYTYNTLCGQTKIISETEDLTESIPTNGLSIKIKQGNTIKDAGNIDIRAGGESVSFYGYVPANSKCRLKYSSTNGGGESGTIPNTPLAGQLFVKNDHYIRLSCEDGTKKNFEFREPTVNTSVTAGSTASPVVGPTTNTTQVATTSNVYSDTSEANNYVTLILPNKISFARSLFDHINAKIAEGYTKDSVLTTYAGAMKQISSAITKEALDDWLYGTPVTRILGVDVKRRPVLGNAACSSLGNDAAAKNEYYLNQNSDVDANVTFHNDPMLHWNEYGKNELRFNCY